MRQRHAERRLKSLELSAAEVWEGRSDEAVVEARGGFLKSPQPRVQPKRAFKLSRFPGQFKTQDSFPDSQNGIHHCTMLKCNLICGPLHEDPEKLPLYTDHFSRADL
jgi:hypothetical protein